VVREFALYESETGAAFVSTHVAPLSGWRWCMFVAWTVSQYFPNYIVTI